MRVDLLIIGGGYYGTAAAVLARERGVDVAVVDSEHPLGASRNSAGLFQPNRHDRGLHEPFKIDWLRERGLAKTTGELFSTWRRPEPRFKPGLTLADPRAILMLSRHMRVRVDRLRRANGIGGWVAETPGGPILCHNVIVAAGVWTDELLQASRLPTIGVKALRGRAMIVIQDGYNDERPRVHMDRPYHDHCLRPWIGGTWRWGSTVEKIDGAGAGPVNALANSLADLIGHYTTEAIADGLRPVVESGFPTELIAPGLVVSTGGRTIGLGLAEPSARRALNLLHYV